MASQADLFQADPEGGFPGDDSDVNGEGAHLLSQDILHIVTWELTRHNTLTWHSKPTQFRTLLATLKTLPAHLI